MCRKTNEKQRDQNSTGCFKIDATHLYDNDLLLRQSQWRSSGTRPIKMHPLS